MTLARAPLNLLSIRSSGVPTSPFSPKYPTALLEFRLGKLNISHRLSFWHPLVCMYVKQARVGGMALAKSTPETTLYTVFEHSDQPLPSFLPETLTAATFKTRSCTARCLYPRDTYPAPDGRLPGHCIRMSRRGHCYLPCAMVHRSCEHTAPATHLGTSDHNRLQLRAIPTVGGSSLPGLSYLGALRMLGDCRDVLEEGYRKARLALSLCLRRRLCSWDVPPMQYPESTFKVAFLDQWMVIVSGRNMVEELRKRGEDELSSQSAGHEVRYLSCEA